MRGRLVIGVILVTLLGACAAAPQVRYYDLTPPAESGGSTAAATRPTQAAGARLGVERFRVDPPYDQDRIVYRVASDPNEIGFYAYHRWALPLDSMLALTTARLLESRPGVTVAEPVNLEATYDFLVGGRLLELDEVDGPDGEEARIEVELTLRSASGAGGGAGGGGQGSERELWRGRFQATASGDAADVAAVVALMEKALDDALGRGTAELVRHLPAPNGPASR